jgi:hypothetical protein
MEAITLETPMFVRKNGVWEQRGAAGDFIHVRHDGSWRTLRALPADVQEATLRQLHGEREWRLGT